MRKYLLLIIVLGVVGCTYHNTYNVMSSEVSATIVDSLSNPISGGNATVIGVATSYGFSSNKGSVQIFGLYEGTFILKVSVVGYYDTLIEFSIQNQENIDLGEIVLRAAPALYDATYYISSTQIYSNYPGYSISINRESSLDTFFVSSDSLTLEISPRYHKWATNLIVRLDTSTVVNMLYRKDYVKFKFPITTGMHTLTIEENEQIVQKVYLYNGLGTAEYMAISFVTNRGGAATLSDYTFTTNADFDLIMVNEKGDTCNYRNRNPIWGKNDNVFENPQYFENFQRSVESIVFVKPKKGVYRIYSHNYYDTLSTQSKDSYMPSYEITLGTKSVIRTAPQILNPNDLWFLGTVTVPQMTFEPVDSIRTGVYYP